MFRSLPFYVCYPPEIFNIDVNDVRTHASLHFLVTYFLVWFLKLYLLSKMAAMPYSLSLVQKINLVSCEKLWRSQILIYIALG